ncbi:MAG: DUF4271 domain-containing protein [Bacteroidales bacterium]
MHKKHLLYVWLILFATILMAFPSACRANVFSYNTHFQYINDITETIDTIRENLPGQQDTLPAPTPAISDTLEEPADTIILPAEPDSIPAADQREILDEDTIQVIDPVSEPQADSSAPTVPVKTVQPEKPRFDRTKAYGVRWDTILARPENFIANRIYPAQEFYGSHELSPAFMQKDLRDKTREPYKDIFTITFLITLLILGLANFLFPHRFRETLLAAFSGRHFNQLEREGGLMDNWVSFFLFLNFIVVFAVFIFLSIQKWGSPDFIDKSPVLLQIGYGAIAIGTFIFIKYIVVSFLAWVFRTENATRVYFLNILTINQWIGIALLPVLIMDVFNQSIHFIGFAWIIFILLNAFKIIRGAYIGHKNLNFSVYYLILYLCAIEIAPLIIVLKIATGLLTS